MTTPITIDAIDPRLVTDEIVALAIRAIGDPVLPNHQRIHTVRRPGCAETCRVLSDALEETGMSCPSALRVLRGEPAADLAGRQDAHLDLADLVRFDRGGRKAMANRFHGRVAGARRNRERDALQKASKLETFCRRAIKRECMLLSEVAERHENRFSHGGWNKGWSRSVGRAARALDATLHSVVYGIHTPDGGRYFVIDDDGDGICLGTLAELCDRYGVRYHVIDDLFDGDDRIWIERRDGVVRVNDGQMLWYAGEESFDLAVKSFEGSIWIGDEWHEAYNQLCAECPSDDGLRMGFEGLVTCHACGEVVGLEDATTEETDHGPNYTCDSCAGSAESCPKCGRDFWSDEEHLHECGY